MKWILLANVSITVKRLSIEKLIVTYSLHFMRRNDIFLLFLSMIKIIISDPAYAPAASFIRKSLVIKINGWQKRGASVTLICSTEAKEFYQKVLPNVEFFTFPFVWKSKTRWTVSLEFIRANFLMLPFFPKMIGKFDIIYSHTATLDVIFFSFILKLFDHKAKWFAVMDNRVPSPSERPGNYILKIIPYMAFLVSNVLLKKTDGMFVVTNLLKEYYEKKGIKVIKTGTGNGLDIESFKGKISPKTPKFIALFGGRIHPAKGIFDLVEITKEIVKKNKDFTLGMMGDGEDSMKKKLSRLIKTNKLSKNIFLLGHKTTKERWDLYRSSNFFLFPSYAEGCPQVVLEAFAANKLVIAYDLPEYRDALGKYINSGQMIIFKKGDVIAVANYIINLKDKINNFHNKLLDFSWDNIVNNEWKAFNKSIE